MSEVKNEKEELENAMAAARLKVAQQILNSDNAQKILESINELCATYSYVAAEVKKLPSGSQEAKRLNKATDEFFTVLMCAMYNKMNSL